MNNMITKIKVLKTSNIEEGELPSLKLPANPEDLINMYDLKDRIILQNSLNDNIEKYIMDYHHSFLKTGEQILQIIPETKLKDYKIYNDDAEETIQLIINDDFFHDPGMYRGPYDDTDKLIKTENGTHYQRLNHYVINFKTKIIYKSSKINTFTFKQKENKLLIRKMFVKHSPFHREYNPCILSKHAQIIVYNLKTNEVISSIKHNLHNGGSGHYSDSWFDNKYL